MIYQCHGDHIRSKTTKWHIFGYRQKREEINDIKNNILDMMTKCDIQDIFWLSNEGHVLQVNALYSDKKAFQVSTFMYFTVFGIGWMPYRMFFNKTEILSNVNYLKAFMTLRVKYFKQKRHKIEDSEPFLKCRIHRWDCYTNKNDDSFISLLANQNRYTS